MFAVQWQQVVPMHLLQQPGQMHEAKDLNPGFQASGLLRFSQNFPLKFQYHVAALTSSCSPLSSPNCTGGMFNFYSRGNVESRPETQKKGGLYHESDDKD